MTHADVRNGQPLAVRVLVLLVVALVALTMIGCSGSSGQSTGDDPAQIEETENVRFFHYTVASTRGGLDTVIDRETGAVYLRWCSGTSRNSVGGVTPLLDEKGEPTVVQNPDDAIIARRNGETTGEERFMKYELNKQGIDSFIDTETGVVYFRWCSGSAGNAVGGISPLIGSDGKPTIDMGYVASLGK